MTLEIQKKKKKQSEKEIAGSKMKTANSQAWMQVWVSVEGLFVLWLQQLEPGGFSL